MYYLLLYTIMYTVYIDTITLIVTILDKSANCRYTLKTTESCIIFLHRSTILDGVELCKHTMQSFYGFRII